MHLGIARVIGVPGRQRRIDSCRIDDRTGGSLSEREEYESPTAAFNITASGALAFAWQPV
jgi:hypothetical protein